MGQLAPRRALVLVLALGLVAVGPASAWGTGPADPATQSQPPAAGPVGDRTGEVVAIEIRLARQSSVRDTAETAAATAGEGFLRADQDRQDAAAAAGRAATSAAAAAAAAETSRRDLVAFALAAARSGGSLDGVQAFLSADGFDQVVQRSAALHRLGARADRAVQRFRAAAVVATALDRRAHRALAARATTAETLRAALAGATEAQRAADAAVSSSRARRDDLIVQLAAARSTTVPIERAGQDRLDADRAARVNAVAQAARTAPAPAASGAAPPVRTAGPAAPAATQLVARKPAASAAATPAATSPAATSPAATSPVATRPATPAAAAPARATPAPAAGPVAPAPRVVPAPAVTTRAPSVTPQPGPARTGSARGSAAGGAAAVAWASTQLNLPYVWGATGPDAYDCSGLTMRAWQIAGLAIPRTSRDQYTAAGKIGYTDLRPGDLIFWGTDPQDPATIYHVAMWVGGGQIVEAARPGVPSRITPMGNRWANTMAYAGRP